MNTEKKDGLINIPFDWIRRGYSGGQGPAGWSQAISKEMAWTIDKAVCYGIFLSEQYEGACSFTEIENNRFFLCRHYLDRDGSGRQIGSYDGIIIQKDSLAQINYNPFVIFRKWKSKWPDRELFETLLSQGQIAISPDEIFENDQAALSYLGSIDTSILWPVVSAAYDFKGPAIIILDNYNLEMLTEGLLITLPHQLRCKLSFSTVPHYDLSDKLQLIWSTIDCRAGLRERQQEYLDLVGNRPQSKNDKESLLIEALQYLRTNYNENISDQDIVKMLEIIISDNKIRTDFLVKRIINKNDNFKKDQVVIDDGNNSNNGSGIQSSIDKEYQYPIKRPILAISAIFFFVFYFIYSSRN